MLHQVRSQDRWCIFGNVCPKDCFLVAVLTEVPVRPRHFGGLCSTLSSQRRSVSHPEEGSTLSPVYKSILLFSPQLWRTHLIFSWIERIIQHFLFLSKTEKKRRLFISCQNVDEQPLLFACLHVKTLRHCSQPGLHPPWSLISAGRPAICVRISSRAWHKSGDAWSQRRQRGGLLWGPVPDPGVAERHPERDSRHLPVSPLHLPDGPASGRRQRGAQNMSHERLTGAETFKAGSGVANISGCWVSVSQKINTDRKKEKQWRVHMNTHVFQHLSALLGL